MALEPGTILGPYEVIAKIGEGGMGEVYRARDTKLDRDVALKVLPQAFTDDPDRLARFEREAKVLASLNHPNIGHIYGLEEAEGQKALVLELVEGPTLAERIKQGPIPVDEALPIAKQIAEALEAAHEQGIIHRDLKPANVKVKDDGTVKVLDFGLAKAFQPDASDVSASMSPTISLTAAATQMGMVIGTAAYMAPEQASGKAVDKRADVWAFGVVLYEMLTGTRPFVGDDVSKTLARVIDREPDWSALPTKMPPVLGTFLRGCLEKDPRERVRDIGDVRLAVKGSFEVPVTAPPAHIAQAQPRFWQRPAAAAIVLLLAVVATALAVRSLQSDETPEVTRFTYEIPLDLPLRVRTRPVIAISPDGRRFVYNTSDGLYLRSMDQLEARLLPGTEEPLHTPFFSPDGLSIGYFQEPGLKRLSLSGGAPVVIASTLPLFSATWLSDATILFADSEGIKRVVATGGVPELLIAVSEGERFDAPQLLPDGVTVLFSVTSDARGLPDRWDRAAVVAQSLATGERTLVFEGGSDARYVSTGHLVYAFGDGLFAVAFDAGSLSLSGGPVSMVEGVERATFVTSTANYAISSNGTLFYLGGQDGSRSPLVWVERDGGATTIDTVPPNTYDTPRLSPDGERVVVVADSDAWVYELTSGREIRITSDGSVGSYAGWNPSGAEVTYTQTDAEGTMNVWMQSADGSGSPIQLTDLEGRVHFDSWSPDGRTLAAHHHLDGSSLLMIPFDNGSGGEAEPWFAREFAASDSVFSPDGRYVAHVSGQTGQGEIYVRPFPGPGGGQTPVSVGGGVEPVWAANGEIFYRRPSDYTMMAVEVATAPTLTVGEPRALFPGSLSPGGSPRARYAVTGDGQRFLMNARWLVSGDAGQAEGPRVNIILNWLQELTERVPIQ